MDCTPRPHYVYRGIRVCIVMPARNEARHVAKAISTLPDFVDRVVIVDDGSTDSTAKEAAEAEVINSGGIGVGGAIAAGYQYLVKTETDEQWCAVVMAGDGQMDPADLPTLLQPITDDSADFVKGNRAMHAEGLRTMPLRRRIGTWWLTHLTNLATGLSIGDPQCGYTVCSGRMLKEWDFRDNWDGYGYPNWWLLRCVESGIRVQEAAVRAIYEGQSSGIRIARFLPRISMMLFTGLLFRGSRWYLAGVGGTPLVKRALVGAGFLGGLALMASTPIIGIAGLAGLGGLALSRYVDREQVAMRMGARVGN